MRLRSSTISPMMARSVAHVMLSISEMFGSARAPFHVTMGSARLRVSFRRIHLFFDTWVMRCSRRWNSFFLLRLNQPAAAVEAEDHP